MSQSHNLIIIMINKAFIAVALPLTFLTHIFEKYVFNDWQFLIALVVVVAVDTLLGLVYHFKSGTISNEGFSKLFIKFILYSCVLILSHVLVSFKINGSENVFFNWVDDALYSAIMLREAISILEKTARISPGLLPKWILKRLKQFDESGNIQDLTNPYINGNQQPEQPTNN